MTISPACGIVRYNEKQRYEIEVKKNRFFSSNEVFESSYEDALNKFENMVDKAVLV